MEDTQIKLSIVVPCCNEEENVARLYDEIAAVMHANSVDYELIYINDGSSDSTLDQLKGILSRAECPVRVIDFSRNFGKEAGIYAGLSHAKGEYTVIMDGDMQQSPGVVMEMYEWLETHPETDCVAAVQKIRGESAVISGFKRAFYFIINKLSEVEFVTGASDFRMMRRNMREAVVNLSEYNRFSKGIFSFVGFNTHYIPYIARARGGGKSKFSFIKLMRYALDGIIGFSTAPLRLISYLGIGLSLASFIYLIVVIIKKLTVGEPVQGYATIVCLLLLLGGLQLLAIGIMGEYIGKSYVETKNRPIYISRAEYDSESWQREHSDFTPPKIREATPIQRAERAYKKLTAEKKTAAAKKGNEKSEKGEN